MFFQTTQFHSKKLAPALELLQADYTCIIKFIAKAHILPDLIDNAACQIYISSLRLMKRTSNQMQH